VESARDDGFAKVRIRTHSLRYVLSERGALSDTIDCLLQSSSRPRRIAPSSARRTIEQGLRGSRRENPGNLREFSGVSERALRAPRWGREENSTSDPVTLSTGKRLGPHEVISRLGAGGM
jgi:hypothetical protein